MYYDDANTVRQIPSAIDIPFGVRRHTLVLAVAVAITVAVGGFGFLSTTDLSNDHFMQLSLAQQVLKGDVPGRDFIDVGMPFAYLISAATQWARPGPVTEMFVCSGF